MNDTNQLIEFLRSERFQNAYSSVLRFVFLLTGVIAVPQALYYLPRIRVYNWFMIGEHYDWLELGIPLLFMPALFWVLVFTLTAHNSALRKKYSAWQKKTKYPTFLFILSQPEFLIKCGLFAVIYLILPLSYLFAALPAALGEFGIAENSVILKLALLVILFVLSLTASVLTVQTHADEDKKKTLGFIGSAVTWLFVFTVGGIALHIFVPIILRLTPVVGEVLQLKVAKIVIALLIAIPIISYARALIKRRKFLSRLYKQCSGMRVRCTKVKLPYLSVFFPSRSLPFELSVGEQHYSCKLICGRRTYTHMRIDEDGKCHYIFTIKYEQVVFGELKRTITFGFESKNPKILIFNPSPHYIYVEHNHIKAQIDNGMSVGGYRIYNTTAFLNAIERDTLGK